MLSYLQWFLSCLSQVLFPVFRLFQVGELILNNNTIRMHSHSSKPNKVNTIYFHN